MIHKNPLTIVLAVALLAAIAAPCVAGEAELIAVLESDAALKDKVDACRLLARVGTRQSVPSLAALLRDEKLAHMARTALETIPDPSADEALRAALDQVEGRLLMGVMGSVGVRRDARAAGAVAKRLAHPDAAVAQAAARALGQIGTPDAAKALEAALSGASAANQLALCEGLFRCAEALAAEGQTVPARAIYDRLRSLTPAAHQVRAGALRGAILVRQREGVPLMLEAIRGDDWVLTAAAARAAMEMPLAEVTAALATELPKLNVDKQLLLVGTLGQRGDATAGPALLALAAEGEPAVRLAAVRNLAHLAYAPALPLLGELSLSGEGELATVARDCLGGFAGQEADDVILAMFGHADAKVRGLAVEMIGLRSVAGAMASLLKAAADQGESVRLAALRALRDQAGATELSALLDILLEGRSSTELQAAESALGALVARQSGPASGNIVIVKAEYGNLPEGPLADVTEKVAALVKEGALAVEASNSLFGDPAHGIVKHLRVEYTVNGVPSTKTVRERDTLTFTATWTPPAIVDAICKAVERARDEPKLGLLRTLRAAGGPQALETVKAATADSESEVRDTALRVLCDWPTPDALPLVAELVKSPPDKTVKILALRGFVRLVPQQDVPHAEKINALQEAMAEAERNEEKRLVLGALGNLPTVESLAVVTAHLEDPALKEEACQAAVAIAERLGPAHRDAVTAAMRQAAKLTANEKLAAKAKELAEKAKP